ncbi:MAG TPA: ATP-binding cassette domain-containing protein, partial [Tepidisphaeraceae bacterium]
FGNDARAGDQLLRVNDLTKSFDGRIIWKDLAFNVKPGERIGIIGPNGSGKTTLLKTLLGELDADSGDIRWGTNLSIGYYDQRLDEFDPDNSILEEVHDGIVPEKKVRDLLGSLLFSGDTVDKRMGDLSGGERARVALAQLMLEKPNVILLDEPTNHLDLNSVEALEKTLAIFDGTLLIVSHDRYFLQKTAERLLVLEPPGMVDYEGTFMEWHEELAAKSDAAKAKPAPAKNQQKQQKKQEPAKPTSAGNKKDNPYLRPFGKLTVKAIEQEIADTEAAIGAAQAGLASNRNSRDQNALRKQQAELDAANKKLKQLEEEYFLRET